MVGLPARGKSYLSRLLSRYFNWISIKTKVFNVGEYRRRLYGTTSCNEKFFRQDNEDGTNAREYCAMLAFKDMLEWLQNDGDVGIFDATNASKERRDILLKFCDENDIKPFFIESICNDPSLINQNVKEVKIYCPDYEGVASNEAVLDFYARIEHYAASYKTLSLTDDSNMSFIQIFDAGNNYIINKIAGYLQSKAVFFLMNLHIRSRSIFITRHGESEYNITGQLGGNSPITSRGAIYAKKLSLFLEDQNIEDLRIWTSELERTKQTAQFFKCSPREHWKALNEIDAGICEGLTYDGIKKIYPEEAIKRHNNKFKYRYPQGESYEDLVERLEPVILELERQCNVVVICHQAVARCLLAYYGNVPLQDLPYLDCPLHTLLKITPNAYNCQIEAIKINTDPDIIGEYIITENYDLKQSIRN